MNIKEIINKHQIMKYPNVIGYSNKLQKKIRQGKVTEIDSIRIYVTKKIPKEQLRKDELIPSELEGIPTDIIEIGKIKKLQGFKSRYRPSPCGVSTSRADENAAGTIGWFMIDEDGNPYLLSNNHVWAKENDGAPGDKIVQPGLLDGGDPENDVIAELYDFISIDFTGNPNRVDVAIATPYLNDVWASIIELGGVINKIAPSVDLTAIKCGRSTGVTKGSITDDSATLNVEYSKGTALFEDVFIVQGEGVIVQGGDSGSPVLSEDMKFLGLLFAGNEEGTTFVACKAANIESEFQSKLAKKIWVLTVNSPKPYQYKYVYITEYQQVHPITDFTLSMILSMTFIVMPMMTIQQLLETVEE